MDLTSFPDHPAYDVGPRSMVSERGPRGEDFAKQVLATVASDLAKPVEALDVLDIGSGYGHTALALARRCKSVVGIEPCLAVARQAQEEQQAKQVHNAAFFHQTLESFET